MSELDVNHNLNDIIVQPQMTRHHHAYRSPMSSEILNLEISQFRFDIAKIYKKAGDLISDLEQKMSALHSDSYTLEGSTFYRWLDETSGNFVVKSVDNIINQLEVLKNRIEILEKGPESA